MDTKSLLNRHRFIVVVLILSAITFSALFPYDSLFPDETSNMYLGNGIMGGVYTDTFLHRLPLIPVAFTSLAWAGTVFSKFVVSLVFFLISIPMAFVMFREVTDEKKAFLSTAVLLAVPFFWRWGVRLTSDVPLVFFTSLAFYLLFRSEREEGCMLWFFIVSLLGMMVKLTFVAVPVVAVLYLAAKNRRLLTTRRSLSGILLLLMVFFVLFAVVSSVTMTSEAGQIERASDRLLSDPVAIQVIKYMSGEIEWTSATQLFKLVMFPLLIFLPFGVAGMWKKWQGRFLLLFLVLFGSMFFTVWVVRIRYFAPLFPIASLFIVEGYFWIKGRLKDKRARIGLKALFSLMLLASVVNSVFILALDHDAMSGAYMLADYTKSLDGTLVSDYLPHYLAFSGSDVLIGGEADAILGGNLSMAENLGVDYIIISVYGEASRCPPKGAYTPSLFGLEFPLIQRPHSPERPPKDYEFCSVVFRDLEDSPVFKKVDDIDRDGQRLFSIYKRVY